jgi:hypothetical protein
MGARSRRVAWRRLAVALLIAAVVSAAFVPMASAVTSGPLSFGAPALIDIGGPYGDPAAFDTISCPSASLCVGDTGAFAQIITSSDPSGTSTSDWSVLPTAQVAQNANGYVLIGVSCVTQDASPFCLAVGTNPDDPFGPENNVFLRSTDPTGGASAWTVQRFAPSSLDGPPSCAAGASTTVCVATNSSGLVWATADAEDPVANGEAGSALLDGAIASACPSAAMCFIAQSDGTVLSSGDPGSASAWISANSSSTGLGSITGFSCPTSTFCIAAGTDASGSQIATSTNPGATTPTWTLATPSETVSALSCAPDSALSAPGVICFSSNGDTTTVSTDGGTTWVSESLASGTTDAFGCTGATASLCVAGTSAGQVSSSADAASGASATWSTPLLVAPGEDPVELFAQSCPSSGVCVGSDGAGRILTSTNPTGGVAAWNVALVDPNGGGIFNLACASITACVAFDNNGSVVTSANPAGGSSTWSAPSSSIDANGISALDCPSSGLCVATDFNGNVLSSSAPPFVATSWSAPASIAGSSYISALACPSSSACVAIDADGNVYTSSVPPFPAATWSSSDSSIDTSPIYELACPSSTSCIAIDSLGRVLTGSAPFTRAYWSAPSASVDPGNPVTELVCATSSLCVAADTAGDVLTSTTPPFNGATWSTSAVDPNNEITGLACSPNLFCLIGDGGGNVVAGTVMAPLSTASPPGVVIATPKPKPSCTIRAKSATVLLATTNKHAHQGKTRRKPGTVSFVVDCDQAASLTLKGKLTEVLKTKRGRKHHKTVSLPGKSGSAQENLAFVFTISFPKTALTALKARIPESVTVTLSAGNANGSSVTTATIRSLKPVSS